MVVEDIYCEGNRLYWCPTPGCILITITYVTLAFLYV